MKNTNIELLAPAGSWEALEAAVNAGANAVYLGGKAFGARAYASNFDREELARAVQFTHMHRVRLYVTVNTLVDDREMEELVDYLLFLNRVGVDGIIVQDLGVIRVAHALVPELPLHASTQMTITSSAGVRFAADHWIVRAVPARELTLSDLQKASAGDTEIEAFIHGALCVCYSGQCLMSSLIGGRSGNRGRCAQPCRLPYTLVNAKGENMLEGKDAGQYLLSPKDLNTLTILPKMVEAGVVSYKIEGRMKRPEYVAIVVDAYRRAMDSYLAGNYHVPEEDFANTEQVFNRDFTTAYLEKPQGREMMSDRRPNNRGVLVGRVQKLSKDHSRAVIKLEKELHLGDGLEFWVKVGGRTGTTVESIRVKGNEVESAMPGMLAEIEIPKGVRLNDRVFRTMDRKLMDYAGRFYGDKNKRRIETSAVVVAHLGEPLRIYLSDDEGNMGMGETEFLAETARKHALDEKAVRKQLDRLGTTEYELGHLSLDLDDGLMVPMSEINEARRKACEALDIARTESFAPSRHDGDRNAWESLRRIGSWKKGGRAVDEAVAKITPDGETRISVWVDTLEKVEAALDAGADWIIFGGDRYSTKDVTLRDYPEAVKLVHKAGRKIAFSTPRIVRENQLGYFGTFLDMVEESGVDLLHIHNLSVWQLARERNLSVPLWADTSLNIYNTQSLQFWKENGAVGAAVSSELNMAQLKDLAAGSPLPLECLVQGPIEMMVSEYCAGGSYLGGLDKGACTFKCGEDLYLHDRKDADFRLAGDQFCRMHVLNSQDLSVVAGATELKDMGISRLRLDARTYGPEEIRKLTGLYKAVLAGAMPDAENLPGTTRGHYFRGVL